MELKLKQLCKGMVLKIAKGVKTGTTDASMLHAPNSGVLEAVLVNCTADRETFTRTSVKFIKKAMEPEIVGCVDVTTSREKTSP